MIRFFTYLLIIVTLSSCYEDATQNAKNNKSTEKNIEKDNLKPYWCDSISKSKVSFNTRLSPPQIKNILNQYNNYLKVNKEFSSTDGKLVGVKFNKELNLIFDTSKLSIQAPLFMGFSNAKEIFPHYELFRQNENSTEYFTNPIFIDSTFKFRVFYEDQDFQKKKSNSSIEKINTNLKNKIYRLIIIEPLIYMRNTYEDNFGILRYKNSNIPVNGVDYEFNSKSGALEAEHIYSNGGLVYSNVWNNNYMYFEETIHEFGEPIKYWDEDLNYYEIIPYNGCSH